MRPVWTYFGECCFKLTATRFDCQEQTDIRYSQSCLAGKGSHKADICFRENVLFLKRRPQNAEISILMPQGYGG